MSEDRLIPAPSGLKPQKFSPRKVANGQIVPSLKDVESQRILVAEDDSLSRKILIRFLVQWGFKPEEASDGQQAMMMLRRLDAPSMAILDWEMPEMDGTEICRRVREADRTLHIIMLSAREGKHMMLEALDAGADDYLTKPCDPDELQARLRVGARNIRLQSMLADQVRELRNAKEELEFLRRKSSI